MGIYGLCCSITEPVSQLLKGLQNLAERKKGYRKVKRYIGNFTKYKFLLSELVKKDIKLKYRRSKLGIVWTLIEPILTTLVLSLVFGILKGKGDAFPVYILTGRLLFSFYSGSTKVAAKSIRSNGGMIRKVYIPKYMYPLASVLSNFVIFMISMIVLVGAMIIFRVVPTAHTILGIIPLGVLFVFSLGTSMILATVEVFFRDLEYLWGVMLTLMMYCSCIFYEPKSLGLHADILKFNPMFSIIYNFRNAVFYHKHLDGFALLYSGMVSLVLLVIGIYVFYKKQDEFILNI